MGRSRGRQLSLDASSCRRAEQLCGRHQRDDQCLLDARGLLSRSEGGARRCPPGDRRVFDAAGEDLTFFYAKESDGPVPQVRKLTKLGDAGSEPALVLLDIPDNGGYYTCDTKVTAETIRAFLADYKAGGKLERKQLG